MPNFDILSKCTYKNSSASYSCNCAYIIIANIYSKLKETDVLIHSSVYTNFVSSDSSAHWEGGGC